MTSIPAFLFQPTSVQSVPFAVGHEVEVNGRGEEVDKVDLQFLRPKPTDFSFDYKWGDAINVWVKDRRWIGRFITRVGRSDTVSVTFRPTSQETVLQRNFFYRSFSVLRLQFCYHQSSIDRNSNDVRHLLFYRKNSGFL
ncbi:hypothetical protein LXL04_015786 [Taraxacum kok-saghyz]